MTAQPLAAEPLLRCLPVPATEPPPVLRLVRPDERVGPLPVVRRPPTVERPIGPGSDRSPHGPPPPAAAWARQFVQAALEAAAGRRPVGQLVRWTSDEVFALLSRRAALSARLGTAGSAPSGACLVRSVRLCRPTASVVEASAVVLDRGRCRAVALRLEDVEGRWRVSALEIG